MLEPGAAPSTPRPSAAGVAVVVVCLVALCQSPALLLCLPFALVRLTFAVFGLMSGSGTGSSRLRFNLRQEKWLRGTDSLLREQEKLTAVLYGSAEQGVNPRARATSNTLQMHKMLLLS